MSRSEKRKRAERARALEVGQGLCEVVVSVVSLVLLLVRVSVGASSQYYGTLFFYKQR